MYAQKLSFDYAHTLHTVRILHNAHSVHRSRVQKGQSCNCINFVRATDPLYNTGSAFEHYDDNLEHSQWINLMRPRLEILWNLLSEEGSIWISIDDDEQAYMKVLCDELFGRSNFMPLAKRFEMQ